MKWEELERKCKGDGGELEPIPCSYYNSYCKDYDECIYHNKPLWTSETDDGWLAYCCEPSRGPARELGRG